MKKKSVILLGLACLILGAGACCGMSGSGAGADPARHSAPGYSNVKEYGAVGDAVYHHPLGIRKGDYDYWAGHFSSLVPATFYEPYQGSQSTTAVSIYKVVPDSAAGSSAQVRLSDVNPAPGYTPAVGDVVVRYEAADELRSVYAADDSGAFEAALSASGGALYLPEGDYMISQLTAAKIKDIFGPGRIWLKEWQGGTLWYLLSGTSGLLAYRNYGWIDADRFHDPVWRCMHWITCLPAVHGWTSSEQFAGNISPRMEYEFDDTRDTVNVWLTIIPAAPEERFPDTVTVCIGKDAAACYSLRGKSEWKAASCAGLEGAMFDGSWNGDSVELPASAWRDAEDWVEITLRREDFFPAGAGGAGIRVLHCWSASQKSIGSEDVEFVLGFARVWLKDSENDGCLMCDIGNDMRPAWESRGSLKEEYIQEACDCASQLLTSAPQEFYAYTVTDDRFYSF